MRQRGAARLPPVRKSLGQHFLTDRRILSRIVDALGPDSTSTVLEIGPGRGALTDILRDRAGRLIGVEVDRALAGVLRERYSGDARVEIVEADALTVRFGDLAGGPYLLVGNLPYNITTPILFHALERPRATRIVLLVQREVAIRMGTGPGGKEYGALSVNLQAVASVRSVFQVPAGAFAPMPSVDSTVVEVVPLEKPAIPPDDEVGFREMVQSTFGMRRKQMRRIVRSLVTATLPEAEQLLESVGIAPDARPETLAIPQFAALYAALRTRD